MCSVLVCVFSVSHYEVPFEVPFDFCDVGTFGAFEIRFLPAFVQSMTAQGRGSDELPIAIGTGEPFDVTEITFRTNEVTWALRIIH